MTALHSAYVTIDGSPNTAEGRDVRRTFLGASEVAAVLGESAYAGPYTIWSQKLHGDETETTLPMAIGTALEPIIIDYAQRDRLVAGVITTRLPTILHPAHRCLGANLDGAILDADGRIATVVECKAWGEFDGDDIDALAIDPCGLLGTGKVWSAWIQMQHQMMVTGARKAVLLALLGKRLRAVEVDPDDAWHAAVLPQLLGFWQYVTARIEPPATAHDLPALSRKPRRERAIVEAPDLAPIFAQYVAARDAGNVADDTKKSASATIRQRLGDAECVTAPGFKATRSANDRLTIKEIKL